MNIIEAPLTKEEKSALRKALIGRVVLFFLMILPIVVFSLYILYIAIMSFVDGDQDMFSYMVPILFILFYYLASKHILPLYKNIFKYGKAHTKEIIEVTVLDGSHVWYSSGFKTFLETEYGPINIRKYVVFFYDIPLLEIRQGMKLYLHLIPGMENEILRISAQPDL